MHSAVRNAVQAFRANEQAKFLQERREQALTVAIAKAAIECGDDDLNEYFDCTRDILNEFDERRRKAKV